jgi:FKBP-type peptidyl-prolyl cis-trans isomerase SlyD
MSRQVVAEGKYVTLTYSISDDQGHVVEQSDLPVGYMHGGRQELIGGMDRAVAGKRAGDIVELALAPGEGFGARDPDLTFTDDIENVPPEIRRVGAEVQMQGESGDVKTFYVTRIENGRLTIDGNHPLAGKALRVKVWIQEVRDPTPAEIKQEAAGHALAGGRLH